MQHYIFSKMKKPASAIRDANPNASANRSAMAGVLGGAGVTISTSTHVEAFWWLWIDYTVSMKSRATLSTPASPTTTKLTFSGEVKVKMYCPLLYDLHGMLQYQPKYVILGYFLIIPI
jgi:hypothetical protein